MSGIYFDFGMYIYHACAWHTHIPIIYHLAELAWCHCNIDQLFSVFPAGVITKEVANNIVRLETAHKILCSGLTTPLILKRQVGYCCSPSYSLILK